MAHRYKNPGAFTAAIIENHLSMGTCMAQETPLALAELRRLVFTKYLTHCCSVCSSAIFVFNNKLRSHIMTLQV